MNSTSISDKKTATITWDLSDIDMEIDLKRTLKAIDLCGVIWDFQQKLREKEKYPEGLDVDTVCKLREDFYSILDEHDININEIYR